VSHLRLRVLYSYEYLKLLAEPEGQHSCFVFEGSRVKISAQRRIIIQCYMGFLSSSRQSRECTSNRPLALTSTSFQNHYSVIIIQPYINLATDGAIRTLISKLNLEIQIDTITASHCTRPQACSIHLPSLQFIFYNPSLRILIKSQCVSKSKAVPVINLCSTMPWRHMEERRYSATILDLSPRCSSRPHAPAALPQVNRHRYPLGMWSGSKSSPTRIRTPTAQPVPLAIPTPAKFLQVY
jgi:hypothetical protein